jgi:hypothetical protein
LERQASAGVELAEAEAKPDVTVSAGYSHETGRFDDQLGLSPSGAPVQLRDVDNILSVGVSIPLSGRRRNLGNIEAATARAASARLRREFLERSIVDAGTAQGDLITQIALANPHVEGIGFDLPEVAPIFEDYVADNELTARVRFEAGSFFTDPLPKADVVTMGHILHDWDLEEKRLLIRRAYEALPQGGAYIVYDSLIDDERRSNAFGLMMSLNMLIETPGGFDYTGADCCGWMLEAGFRETRVEHLLGPEWMVIGIR